MKPGCFIKSIIVLTIIVAAIAYIIQHKSGLLFNNGKKMLTEVFLNDWDQSFAYVKNTPEKNELKDSLKTFLENIKIQNIPADKELNRIIKMVQNAAADSVISDSELELISNNLKSIKNERPEQNRN